MDAYATHLEPLVKTALESKGPILELGCGDYSTPILAAIAKHKGTTLTVLSSDRSWSDRFRHLCDIWFVPDWSKVVFPPSGMVLLDNEQITADRIRHLPALALTTDSVVVHDLEACERHAHWPAMIAPFRERWVYRTHNPGTAVLSC